MVERVCRIKHYYDGRLIDVGDRFNVEPEHVNVLFLLGRIEPVEGEPGYIRPKENKPEAQTKTKRKQIRERAK